MCHTILLMRKMLIVAIAVIGFTLPSFGQVSEGDQHWKAGAEGHQGGRAKAGQVDAAIAAYRKAVAQEPNNLEARGKLLRAVRFKGAYVASTSDEKKAIYAIAKNDGDAAMAVVNRQLAAKGVKADAPEKNVADAARAIPGAADLFLSDSVNWCESALAYGNMAARHTRAHDRNPRECTNALV